MNGTPCFKVTRVPFKNLIDCSTNAGYGIFLTTDQGIPHQQNRAAPTISILIIRSHTNQIEGLLAIVGTILSGLAAIHRGEIRWYTFRHSDRRRPVSVLTRDEVLERLNVPQLLLCDTEAH